MNGYTLQYVFQSNIDDLCIHLILKLACHLVFCLLPFYPSPHFGCSLLAVPYVLHLCLTLFLFLLSNYGDDPINQQLVSQMTDGDSARFGDVLVGVCL